MKLEDLGYSDTLEKFRIEHDLNNLEIGRVTSEHRERYTVKTIKGEFQAEITGNIRFTAKSREDFPAVGDWVALTTHAFDFTIIHSILPRFSMIKRQAVGQFGEVQIIATNINYAFIIQAVDNNFNINRLERYLTICNSSNINSIIVLTKTDLIDEHRINEILDRIKTRIKNTPIIPISNITKNGYEIINSCIEQGKTYCMLGSSGVGKSTLLNNLSGKSLMRTDEISQSTNKGKHVTSHRQLIILENGGILIDTPGMREIGIADTERGLETTFDMIVRLSNNCKFKDCTHTIEKGCAILEAIKNGEIEKDSYENYLKMESEKKHFESTIEEKRKKDKAFGKMVKNYKKNINRKK